MYKTPVAKEADKEQAKLEIDVAKTLNKLCMLIEKTLKAKES